MDARARNEYLVIGGLLVLLLIFLLPSLREARREVRDGVRRTELIERKVELEQINNEIGYYPLEYDASPHEYMVLEHRGDAAIAWYLRARLEREGESQAGFDEEYNVFYEVTLEDGASYYYICGGEYTCGIERDE